MGVDRCQNRPSFFIHHRPAFGRRQGKPEGRSASGVWLVAQRATIRGKIIIEKFELSR